MEANAFELSNWKGTKCQLPTLIVNYSAMVIFGLWVFNVVFSLLWTIHASLEW